jgi:hypothetical protein
MSHDQNMIYLDIDFLDGKYTTQKSFRNNAFELQKLEVTQISLNTDQKVRKYFNLGESENEKRTGRISGNDSKKESSSKFKGKS